MQVGYAQLMERSPAVAVAIADARSARNLQTRRERAASKADEIDAARSRRRRRQKEKEELLTQLSRRVHVKMPDECRPKVGRSTARKLYQRASGLRPGTFGTSNSRGSDGLCSIHYAFTPRGFASQKGRRWRAGEAERAARYITREEGLEDGELGWWSNIAEERIELVGFFRTAEALEKHDRDNANVYISEIIALPADLTARQRRFAVRRICRFFEKRGLGYVAAMHLPDKAGDQRNFHCHILYSLRPCERLEPFEWSFAVAKEADINTPAGIAARRVQIVRDINSTLHAAGIDKRYTHLSNKARRMAEASPNVGQVGTWIDRRLAAMEARQELLKKVQSLAGRMRSVLVDSSVNLAKLRVEVERRNAEAARGADIVHTATENLPASTHSLGAARQNVERALKFRHARTGSTNKSVRTIIGHHTAALSQKLEARRQAIREISKSAAVQVRKKGRHAELRAKREAIVEVHPILESRTHRAATAVREKLDTILSATSLHEKVAEARLTNTKGSALIVARGLMEKLNARAHPTQQRLRRTFERSQMIGALLGKREAFESDEAEFQRRSALYLPAWRKVASNRVNDMRSTVETVSMRERELTRLRTAIGPRLLNLYNSVTSPSEHAVQRLAAIREQSRQSIANGIGKGPQHDEPSAERTKVPPSAKTTAALSHLSRQGFEAPTAAVEAAPRGRSEIQERLREIVRKREPDKTIEMFPDPRGPSPAPADAHLLAVERLELARAEARKREMRVRKALRKTALDRLLEYDIQVYLNAQGKYEIAAGHLFDEEMRVLMLPSLERETQRFLAEIARQQHLQATAKVLPLTAPHTDIDRAGPDLATLAAARSKTKGIGDD